MPLAYMFPIKIFIFRINLAISNAHLSQKMQKSNLKHKKCIL